MSLLYLTPLLRARIHAGASWSWDTCARQGPPLPSSPATLEPSAPCISGTRDFQEIPMSKLFRNQLQKEGGHLGHREADLSCVAWLPGRSWALASLSGLSESKRRGDAHARALSPDLGRPPTPGQKQIEGRWLWVCSRRKETSQK